jgi:hypothetical protein
MIGPGLIWFRVRNAQLARPAMSRQDRELCWLRISSGRLITAKQSLPQRITKLGLLDPMVVQLVEQADD